MTHTLTQLVSFFHARVDTSAREPSSIYRHQPAAPERRRSTHDCRHVQQARWRSSSGRCSPPAAAAAAVARRQKTVARRRGGALQERRRPPRGRTSPASTPRTATSLASTCASASATAARMVASSSSPVRPARGVERGGAVGAGGAPRAPDHAARRLRYAVVDSNMGFGRYVATLRVLDGGSGCPSRGRSSATPCAARVERGGAGGAARRQRGRHGREGAASRGGGGRGARRRRRRRRSRWVTSTSPWRGRRLVRRVFVVSGRRACVACKVAD